MPSFSISPLFEVLILAIVQGIAEFLPISSSGHLVAVEALLGRHNDSAELGIVLHFGTLLAILLYYRHRIWELLTTDRQVIPMLIVGTLPAATLGLWLKSNHEWLLKSPLLAGFMLVITAYLLMLLAKCSPEEAQVSSEEVESDTEETETKRSPVSKTYRSLGYFSVVLIGCAQAFALLPGISRSGSTIVMGVLCGLSRGQAATFSFLLAIPAISGATLLEAKDILEHGAQTPLLHLAIGAGVSFVVGLASLHGLILLLERSRLHWFAYWLIPFGFSIVIWQLYQMVNQNGAF